MARRRQAGSALDRALSDLEEHTDLMSDDDIEFLDELGRFVMAGGTILTVKEKARLRALEKEYLE